MDPLQQQGGSSAGQPSLLSLEQQPETQMNKQGQIHKKAGGKPFVPWKDCTYFLKGHCPKGETCTFKHDLEARNAQLFKPLPEDARKARGVCKFEKSGSCTKGDLCLFSHDLSDEPCVFYHLMGVCERGALCKFGHQPITPEQLQQLRDNRNKTS
ncbi:hypothetical protein EDD21DRAFT_299656 [Dissophora ornata]|nr:hypothetical protein EDD21DRAFT_299656 [Dissophora ornata]